MRRRINAWLERLRGSFWFLPPLMACGAALLAFAVVQVDRELAK